MHSRLIMHKRYERRDDRNQLNPVLAVDIGFDTKFSCTT